MNSSLDPSRRAYCATRVRPAGGFAACLDVWTRGGFTIVQKRLERGTFAFPGQVSTDAKSIDLDVHELSMLLEGIDPTRVRRSPRWEPPVHARTAP